MPVAAQEEILEMLIRAEQEKRADTVEFLIAESGIIAHKLITPCPQQWGAIGYRQVHRPNEWDHIKKNANNLPSEFSLNRGRIQGVIRIRGFDYHYRGNDWHEPVLQGEFQGFNLYGLQGPGLRFDIGWKVCGEGTGIKPIATCPPYALQIFATIPPEEILGISRTKYGQETPHWFLTAQKAYVEGTLTEGIRATTLGKYLQQIGAA